MINNVLSFPNINPDLSQIKPVPDVPKEVAGSSASSQSKNDTGADLAKGQAKDQSTPAYQLRLTVEKDPKTGEWVYKAIDRNTGEVVREMPRNELVALRKSSSYTAGSVIKTEV
ncbi:flagellar protein FlaG [Asticcacaulis sp. 201]|uniref:flagellar protein FlaG n=1 Tax=Asticcacaulis sp. 201 TaxID=3028787 RepID=UPI00291700E3|nr:flagellar protein FlaG [Asticcacaulis sp. 201]MDV6329564.1 flagellar protein FlaG [Asticcacaulis sp. 201]